MNAQHLRGDGFSLLEVLVVVAIILILAAVLLPALASSREEAKSAVCLSNLKQMGGGVLMYTQDSHGVLPGPIDDLVFRNCYVLARNSSTQLDFWQPTLNCRIKRYVGDVSKEATLLDKLATCPTADSLIRGGAAMTHWAGPMKIATPTYRVNTCEPVGT